MAHAIVALIPEHSVYTEAFFGGGVILFAKPQCTVEVINDINITSCRHPAKTPRLRLLMPWSLKSSAPA